MKRVKNHSMVGAPVAPEYIDRRLRRGTLSISSFSYEYIAQITRKGHNGLQYYIYTGIR